jgi:Zn-dependent oligopeptidase
MRADGVNGPLEPWDWRYYAEKRRKAEHDLDEAELKPFFQLDAMIEAAFDCANPAVRAGVRAARRGRSTTPTRAPGR